MLVSLVMWLLIVVQAVAILAIAKRLLEVQRLVTTKSGIEASTLPIGQPAPAFSATNIFTQELVRSSQLLGAGTRVFVFLSPHCGNCRGVAEQLRDLTHAERAQLVVYCDGTKTGCQNRYARLSDSVAVLVKHDSDVATAYEVGGMPAAVFLDSRGRVTGAKYIFDAKDALSNLPADPETTDDGVVSSAFESIQPQSPDLMIRVQKQ